MARLSLFIFFFSFILSVSAQTVRELPDDTAEFIGQVPRLYDNIQDREILSEVYFVVDSLTREWKRKGFNEEEKHSIIRVTNNLLKRRLKSWPYMYHHFNLILQFHKREGELDAWFDHVEDIETESSLRQLQGFFEDYTRFFKDKKLNGSTTTDWVFTDSLFRFEYDGNARFLFGKTHLLCASSNDTSIIKNTQGIYFPIDQKWQGFGGTISWRRFGINEDSIRAELSKYDVDLGKSSFSADSVAFFDKRFFDMGILGELSEKVFSSRPNQNTPYPEFVSYLRNYELRDLFKDISYEGGVTLKGLKFIGSGDKEKNARIIINIDEDKVMVFRSQAFSISDDEILANPASMVIAFNGDSVYHPGLKMRYSAPGRIVQLVRGEQGIANSPFFNTYHKVDMNVESMIWNLDEKKINFTSDIGLSKVSMADFISNNFYSQYEFDRLQGIDARNPLYVVRNYSRDYNTREISPSILADYMSKPPEQIKAMLIRLSSMGFLYYDIANDRAIIEERLFDYIKSNLEQIDYDVISIHSETFDQSNATLDLDNMELLVRGVDEVFLSDSQNVYIYPERREIILKKNRDFVFTGKVRAGLFEFFASECYFEYDSFRLNLPTVDSLRFHVASFEEDERGEYPIRGVNTVIEDLTGTLYIDEPRNKSGLKSFPQYPLFESEQESFAYYDSDSIYLRDGFKYHVAPFRFESLDNFSTEGLEFQGFLSSDGIFPEIEQPLKVQPDYSLGFVRDIEEEGVLVYGGKGRFYSTIDLSNLGLRAEGRLEYLTSVSESDNFIFYPDSMVAYCLDTFLISSLYQEVEFPEVSADSVFQQWYPYSDTMLITMLEDPFEMYDSHALHHGQLVYTDKNLTGSGIVEFESSELSSNRLKFGHHTIDADTLDFRLYTIHTDSLVLDARNYRAMLDFEMRQIQFRANEKKSVISFPYNSFDASMESIDWYMDENQLVLSNNEDEDLDFEVTTFNEMLNNGKESTFISSNTNMDSLGFYSGYANYDLNRYIMDVEQVPFIKVADAAIFPYNGTVRIFMGGRIEPFENADIIATINSRAHKVRQASVEIFSRKYYEGSGYYVYDDGSGLLQDIHMVELRVDSIGNSIGKGLIKPENDFLLNPYFSFTGNVELNASDDLLSFEGGYRLLDDCLNGSDKNWVYFNSRVDPKNIVLPVRDTIRDIHGGIIESGIYHSSYTDDVYPALFSNKKATSDTAVFNVSGFVTYDSVQSAYLISGSPEDQANKNRMAFDTRRCIIQGSGPLNLGLHFGSYMNVEAAGTIKHYIIPDTTRLEVSLLIDFFFYEAALKMMVDTILGYDLKGLDISNKNYADALDFFLGSSESMDMGDDLGIFGGSRRVPERLKKTFFFTDVNMKWNDETRSFISNGPFAIGNIGDDQVNRYVNGHLEMVRKRSGDELNILIEVGSDTWYFFNYRSNVMQTLSSDMTYNGRISELKTEKKILKNDDEEEQYEFVIASRRKWIEFRRKMEEYAW